MKSAPPDKPLMFHIAGVTVLIKDNGEFIIGSERRLTNKEKRAIAIKTFEYWCAEFAT